MSQTARKFEVFTPATPLEETPARQAARVATADDLAFDSPALRLQAHLEALVEEPQIQGRWSARKTLGFLVAVNGVFWVSLVWLISRFW